MSLSDDNPSPSTEGIISFWSSKCDESYEKDDDSSSSASSTFQEKMPGIMYSLCTLFQKEDV
jgi:hypothetical protein